MIRSLRGLRGFYGGTAPKMPFGLNITMNGNFPASAKPALPFGLNAPMNSAFPVPGKSTFPKPGAAGPSLGCGSCGTTKRLGGLRRRLGQIYDPVSGDYTSSLPAQDNPASLPLAPTQAAFNANPYSYSGIAAGGEAGASIQNFTAATGYSPLTPTGMATVPSVGVTAIPVFNNPASSPLTSGTLATSSLSAYLPFLVLGLGGIVFIAALKRR
jgi:hypothetical protein